VGDIIAIMLSLILSVVLIGVSLAMDAFAVSVCDGMIYRDLPRKKMVLFPLAFCIFQMVMPLIGFYISFAFTQIEAFDDYDHWIAFALLAIIGGKMVFDGAKELIQKQEEVEGKPFSYVLVLLQAIATSIDALFVGISFSAVLDGVSNTQLWAWISVGIIGAVTFAISLTGVVIGKKFGQLFRKKASVAEIIGGIVLILIGVKMLLSGLEILSF